MAAAVFEEPASPAIVPALLAGHPPRPPAGLDPRARCTGRGPSSLLVLDGLGWDALGDHPDALPTLVALAGGPITTVVPSTTASALTSITTGLAPAQHGVVGFRVLVDGRVLNVLSWQSANGRRAPDPFSGAAPPPVPRASGAGRDQERVPQQRVHRRAPARYAVHGLRAPRRAWSSTCGCWPPRGSPSSTPTTPGIDEVAHAHGLHDGFYPAELGGRRPPRRRPALACCRRTPRSWSRATTARSTSDPRVGSVSTRSTS